MPSQLNQYGKLAQEYRKNPTPSSNINLRINPTFFDWRNIGRYLLVIIVLLILIYGLASQVKKSDLQAVWNSSLLEQPTWLIGFFFINCVCIFMRSLRMQTVSGITGKRLWPIVTLHMFFSNIMPMQSGEFSYPILMKRHFAQSWAQSFAQLAVQRFCDLLVFALLTMLCVAGVLGTPQSLFLTVCIIFIIMLLVGWWQRKLLLTSFCRWITARKWLKEDRLQTLDDFCGILIRVETGVLVCALIWTIGIWITIQGSQYILLYGLHISLSFTQTAIAGSFLLLTSLLPIQAPGNIGSFEFALTGGLVCMGVSPGLAVLAATTIHLLGLLFSSILALVAWIVLQLIKLPNAGAEQLFDPAKRA